MDNGFLADFIVEYGGISPDHTLSFPRLMALMQEASVRHTESTAHPMEWYRENGFVFLLTNWRVKVEKYPRLHDAVAVYTYPTYFKGIISERYFEMRDGRGDIVARASSKWVYMDLNRRRPAKPPEEIVNGYGPPRTSGMEGDYALPEINGDYEPASDNEFIITRRDIDTNRHANNVKYIEWAADYIPDSLYDNNRVCEAKFVYKKECARGLNVKMETHMNGKSMTEAYCALKDSKEPGALLFEAYFKFTKPATALS